MRSTAISWSSRESWAPVGSTPGEELAAEYGVSRIPVRDALRLLEGEGLVSYTAHHGYQITRLTEEELLELQRLREILEDEAVRVGAPKITAAALVMMNAALTEMHHHEQAGDLASWGAAHRTFHFALYESAGMPSLTRIFGQAWDASDLYRSRYLRTRPGLRSASAAHRPILAAARARDPDALLSLMERHRGTILGWLRHGAHDGR
ncbi:MAG: FCD domain-containing protein [Actinophytocola sp.]|uniref:GntR family transcriptional regulator n=1 Tax=Actinophytocola sp. TaxID=1872138 RepID=UPI0013221450|nr:GntR family transcriptional regulator [Actinophytocola sp.]MPZ79732.1 FCD domain-containing protein [Actinophytocola sp.]